MLSAEEIKIILDKIQLVYKTRKPLELLSVEAILMVFKKVF